jgi:NADP-dependent 3-hydroxy acid dehydrogenase YdfG
MSTADRVCLVTGAAGGLGSAIAEAFGGAGFHVIVAGRDAAALRALASVGRTTAIVADVADPDDVRRLGTEVAAVTDRLDVLVANAGQATGGSFLAPAEPLEPWREMVLTNVYGSAAVARTLLPALVRARGSLFFIGSVTARTVRPGDLYSATKHAVAALAEAIRLEVERTGVQVCVVQPGVVDTPLLAADRRSGPLLDPRDVAAEILRLAGADRRFDVNELVLRPRAG